MVSRFCQLTLRTGFRTVSGGGLTDWAAIRRVCWLAGAATGR
jgi:hypothetical protein